MSKRYGRNQKRKARETISNLENKVDSLEQRLEWLECGLRSANRRADDAKNIAFQELIKRGGQLEYSMADIRRELVRGMQPVLAEEANRILDARYSHNRSEPLVSFQMYDNPMDNAVFAQLRGSMPSFHYQIVIGN